MALLGPPVSTVSRGERLTCDELHSNGLWWKVLSPKLKVWLPKRRPSDIFRGTRFWVVFNGLWIWSLNIMTGSFLYLIDFEREGEKHWPVASCTHPNRGLNPTLGCVPCLGIEPSTFWCTGRCSHQLSRWPGPWLSLTKCFPHVRTFSRELCVSEVSEIWIWAEPVQIWIQWSK